MFSFVPVPFTMVVVAVQKTGIAANRQTPSQKGMRNGRRFSECSLLCMSRLLFTDLLAAPAVAPEVPTDETKDNQESDAADDGDCLCTHFMPPLGARLESAE